MNSPNSTNNIVIYLSPISAPCRAVWMICKLLDLRVNIKVVNLMLKEHTSVDFVRINPIQSVPTLDDNGFYLWESRAILIYLVEKYSKDDQLYPKDLEERAIVNRMMFFDMTPLNYSITQWIYPQIYEGKPSDKKAKEMVVRSLNCLDEALRYNMYAAGKKLTIADISIFASILSLECVGFNFLPFNRIQSWLTLMKLEIPHYKIWPALKEDDKTEL